MTAHATADQRRDAVARGLTPIVRTIDNDVRWTIDERLAHYGCPATSVAVIRNGEIDWVDGWGSLDADRDGTCGPDTIFMVASCSKPVTAMLVLQQAARGVVDLDTDVNTYLRRWQVPANEFTARQPVTLRHCLSHTAGLTVNGWGVVPRDGRPVPTLLDLLEGRQPSKMPPVVVDKHYDGVDRYSGGGYVIAQMVLEDVTGRSFPEIADETLFGPLGMTRSTFRQPLPEQFHTDVASGHGDDGRPAAGGWMISGECAAGGLFSTARDYARFLIGVRASVLGLPGAVLPQEWARLIAERHDRGAFSLGARVIGDGPVRRLSHGGSNDGYQTESAVYLESGDGGVVFTNSTSGLFLFREVFNSIALEYDWQGFLPAPKRLRQLSDDERQRYVGQYRIVAGIELPLLKVWEADGKLWNEVPGLRFGVQEVFCDDQGSLFNQTGPFETAVTFGDDGRAAELVVSEGGAQVLRAVRVPD